MQIIELHPPGLLHQKLWEWMGQAICILTSLPEDFEALKVNIIIIVIHRRKSGSREILSLPEITHNQWWKWDPASGLHDSTIHIFPLWQAASRGKVPKQATWFRPSWGHELDHKWEFEVLFPNKWLSGGSRGRVLWPWPCGAPHRWCSELTGAWGRWYRCPRAKMND